MKPACHFIICQYVTEDVLHLGPKPVAKIPGMEFYHWLHNQLMIYARMLMQ